MIKIKILETNEIKIVTKNTAHSLIDSGHAMLYVPGRIKKTIKEKMMRPGRSKGYKIK